MTHNPEQNSLTMQDLAEMMPLSTRTPNGAASPSMYTSTVSPRDSLRESQMMTQAGSTSRFINESKDFFAAINGGTMRGVMQEDYSKDYV